MMWKNVPILRDAFKLNIGVTCHKDHNQPSNESAKIGLRFGSVGECVFAMCGTLGAISSNIKNRINIVNVS